jgi:hypothetical protein
MPAALFRLHPSRSLLHFLFILYGLLLITLVFSACPLWIIILYVLSAVLSFYKIHQKQCCFQQLSFGYLPHRTIWKIYDTHLQEYSIKLQSQSFCSRFIIILNFIVENKAQKISLVILPDSLTRHEFKLLRIYLFNSRMEN